MCRVVLGSLIGGGNPVLLSFHSAAEDTDACSGWTDAIVDHAHAFSGLGTMRLKEHLGQQEWLKLPNQPRSMASLSTETRLKPSIVFKPLFFVGFLSEAAETQAKC